MSFGCDSFDELKGYLRKRVMIECFKVGADEFRYENVCDF